MSGYKTPSLSGHKTYQTIRKCRKASFQWEAMTPSQSCAECVFRHVSQIQWHRLTRHFGGINGFQLQQRISSTNQCRTTRFDRTWVGQCPTIRNRHLDSMGSCPSKRPSWWRIPRSRKKPDQPALRLWEHLEVNWIIRDCTFVPAGGRPSPGGTDRAITPGQHETWPTLA